MSDHDRYESLQAGYLLGALDDGERADFERHLAGCGACRSELRWLSPAVDVLAGGVEQLAPPERLRARIVGAVEADVRGPRATAAAERRPRWRRLGLPRLATGLAVTVALAIGLAGGYALRGSDESATRVATVPVEPTTPVVQASGSVVAGEDHWRLDLTDMPELRPGDVYQVWLRHGQSVSPSVLFVPSRHRDAQVVLPAAVGSADELLVTREPAGGSREPTSAPLVSATLQ